MQAPPALNPNRGPGDAPPTGQFPPGMGEGSFPKLPDLTPPELPLGLQPEPLPEGIAPPSPEDEITGAGEPPAQVAVEPKNSDDQKTTKLPTPVKPAGDKDGALKQYALIINKNLFSPERKKWVSPPAGGTQAGAQAAKKTLDKLVLYGTIISPQGRYAVLRTKKTKKSRKSTQETGGFQPYTLGDYIAGYLIQEIDAKKVTLVDESTNQEYTVFINADQKVRKVEKTARKAAKPKPVVRPKRPGRAAKKRVPRKPPAIPAQKWRK